jgi:carbonic anhydrase
MKKAACSLCLAVFCAAAFLAAGFIHAAEPVKMSPDAELGKLLAGNALFVKGKTQAPRRAPADFAPLAAGQKPQAVIVCCSDSRVPPEIFFDSGIGELFVVRVAGNVVGGTGVVVMGSIEYAVAELNVPLIIVIGHSQCGAVKAAVEHINEKESLPGAIDGLVELIKPAAAEAKGDPGIPLDNVILENVKQGVKILSTLDPIIAPRVKAGTVKVVGGVYDLTTGKVTMVE